MEGCHLLAYIPVLVWTFVFPFQTSTARLLLVTSLRISILSVLAPEVKWMIRGELPAELSGLYHAHNEKAFWMVIDGIVKYCCCAFPLARPPGWERYAEFCRSVVLPTNWVTVPTFPSVLPWLDASDRKEAGWNG
jgi:hypothetical protein